MFCGNPESSPSINGSVWDGLGIREIGIEVGNRNFFDGRKLIGLVILGTQQKISVAQIDTSVGVLVWSFEIRPDGNECVDLGHFLRLFSEIGERI